MAVPVPVAAAASTIVVPLEPVTNAWVVVLTAICPSAVGIAPAADGIRRPVVAGAACKSRMADAPPESVCVANVKSAPMSLTAVVLEA